MLFAKRHDRISASFRHVRKYGPEHNSRTGLYELGFLGIQDLEFERKIEATTSRGILQFAEPPQFRARLDRWRASAPRDGGSGYVHPRCVGFQPGGGFRRIAAYPVGSEVYLVRIQEGKRGEPMVARPFFCFGDGFRIRCSVTVREFGWSG